jgi:F-type H+-transporting ATPase subunit gamma
MPSLKDLRNRIRSVQSTKKITSAMKVVAASRLKKATDAAIAARPYAERMERMLVSLAASMAGRNSAPMLTGTGRDSTHLLIVATSDRGLAGGFNATILREARRRIRTLQGAGKTVKLITIGRKGRDALRRDYGKLILESYTEIGRRGVAYTEAKAIGDTVVARFLVGEFDVATIIFNTFKSAISQVVTSRQIVPFGAPKAPAASESGGVPPSYEFEPDEESILADLLPTNLAVQVFGALLENTASEHGARMTAMDNATRNAGKMIDRLTLNYNRAR